MVEVCRSFLRVHISTYSAAPMFGEGINQLNRMLMIGLISFAQVTGSGDAYVTWLLAQSMGDQTLPH